MKWLAGIILRLVVAAREGRGRFEKGAEINAYRKYFVRRSR